MEKKNWSMAGAMWRAKWLIAFLILLVLALYFVTEPNSTGRLVVYKLMLAVIAAIAGHMIVKGLYPYIDLKELLYHDKEDEVPDALKFLGACILRAMVMAAAILGILLGI